MKRVSAELEQAKASLADLQSKVASSESQGEGVSALQKQLAEAQSRSEAAEKEVSSLKEAAAAAPAGGDDGAKEKLAKALTEAEEKAAAQQKVCYYTSLIGPYGINIHLARICVNRNLSFSYSNIRK